MVDDAKNYFRKGDIIVGIDGQKVKDMSSLKKLLLNYSVGDKAKVEIVRSGEKKSVDFEFSMDSSNIEEFKEASPKNEIKENDKNGQQLPDWLRP